MIKKKAIQFRDELYGVFKKRADASQELIDGIAGNRFNHTALSALKDNQRKVLSAPKLLEWLVLWEVGDDLNILIKSDESQVLSELYQFVDQVLTAKKVIGDLQFSD